MDLLNEKEGYFRRYWEYERYLESLDVDSDIEKLIIKQNGNKYFNDIEEIELLLSDILDGYNITCYHYTRLIDEEIERIKSEGFTVSTPQFLSERTQILVDIGYLSSEERVQILQDTPLGSQKYGHRDNQVWFTTDPFETSSNSVNLLVGSWGGESTYWCLRGELSEKIKSIGTPRIVEVLLTCGEEIENTKIRSISGKMINRFCADKGLIDYYQGSDICDRMNVSPEKIVQVISSGDQRFTEFGKTYPDDVSAYSRFK